MNDLTELSQRARNGDRHALSVLGRRGGERRQKRAATWREQITTTIAALAATVAQLESEMSALKARKANDRP